MRIERARARAERFFVEEKPAGFGGAAAAPPASDAVRFALLAHREHLRSVEVVARASDPGFVRLAYSFDPGLTLQIDGEPTLGVADFLGGVVVPFPAGTHSIVLEAPRESLRLRLLWISGGIATALALLQVWSRRPRERP
jgi:hypothetical protein